MEQFKGIVFRKGKEKYFHVSAPDQAAIFVKRRKRDGCTIEEVNPLKEKEDLQAFLANAARGYDTGRKAVDG